MVTVPARILDPPSVEYRGKKTVQPRDGGWNLMGSKFHIPGRKLEECGVLLLQDELPGKTNYVGGNDPDLTKVRGLLSERHLVVVKHG